MKVGDIVWVKTGWLSHEELGTVIDVASPYEDDNGEVRSDGIFVRLQINNTKETFPPAAARPFIDGQRRNGRQTARRPICATSSQSSRDSSKEISETPTREKLKALVTPSPVASTEGTILEGDDAAKKRPQRGGARVKFSDSECCEKVGGSEESLGDRVDENPSETSIIKKRKRGEPKRDPGGARESRKAAEENLAEEEETESDIDTSNSKKGRRNPQENEGTSTRNALSNRNGGNRQNLIMAEESDDEDRPFIVEYSPTGRASCRRCDEIIAKGSLRVSHVPLFRGKPGFRVYRHLHCAVFPEEVDKAEDVGGWRRLDPEDYEALCLRIEESKLELEKENEDLQPDELVQQSFQGEIRGSPKGLVANLLPFQVEGVSWMHHQEVKIPQLKGGILADEMGMGKTLQTITTVLDNMPKLQHCKPNIKHPPSAPDLRDRINEEAMWATAFEEWKQEMVMNNIPKKMWSKRSYGSRAGTLVICPVIALSQWKSEIEKFTEPGTLTVGVYHGPNRAKENPREILQKYDIVLTTYQVIEHDFRKMVSPNKVACPNCGAKFKIDKLRIHLKYFCGEGAQRTEAQARQARTAERHGSSRRGHATSKGKEKTKKKAFSKTKTATKTTSKEGDTGTRNKRLSKGSKALPHTKESKARPSRSAARIASKKLKGSMQEWTANDGSDDESFVSNDDSLDDDESSVGSDEGVTSEDNEAESSALERARKKQKLALEQAKKTTGKMVKSKKGQNKEGRSIGKGQKNAGHKRFTKNKKKKGDPSGSDFSSSEGEASNRDPLDNIDLDGLMNQALEGACMSVLHSMCWWRIVLDEAHMIKSRSSQTAAAAFALSAIHRWCLSGTPLQNRVGELYSLIRFLRLDPMAHYFCRQKGCTCKSLHYRILHGKCQDCGHRGFSHFSHFNKHILNPIQRDGYSGDGRAAMFKLKNEVLDLCLLRRTKESRAEDMNLPPRIVSIRPIRLHPVEEDFYNALYTQTRSSFDDYVAEGTLLNNYAHIFDLLTKMRQAVDHPYLIVYSKRNCERTARTGASQVVNGSTDCELCHEPPTECLISTCCGGAFCRSCVLEYMTATAEGAGGVTTQCPACRSPFSIDLNQEVKSIVDDSNLAVSNARPTESGSPMTSSSSLKELSHVMSGSILRRINLVEFSTSSKIEVLVQELIEMRQLRPGSKALVFSQFVNMLDLIRWRLHSDSSLVEMGLGVRILHGGMNAKSRDACLKDFREDTKVRVLLMSLKAGGVALNLTVASEVFLMDNWWNPAAEMQAIDRTHRLGQYRPIRAVRFIAEGTVEERVLQLQEKKRLVFDGTVGRDAGSLKMLTVEDMKSLFN